MATELENSIRNAAATVAKYVEDVATMTVRTEYVVVGPEGDVDFEQAKPIARTEISFDGDSAAIVPMREAEAGRFELDAALLDLHERNVTTTIEYRARILDALIGVLQSRIK